MMDIRIQRVLPDSIGEALELTTGDRIVRVNGRDDLEDQFDWEFEVLLDDIVELEVIRAASPDEAEILEIEKDEGEDLGLVFASPLFTPIKTCNNACPFCFIDQQPDGLRPTLYIKDDDWRLSYFSNTYITLTNLTRHDRERIERIRPGPLYVSVHSTVPDIRERLLVNKKAREIMTELRWLASLDIPFHAQLVINPGINDGESFSQTLADLATLHPQCQSVAVVPVGLTQHREKLPELDAMNREGAIDILDRLAAFNSESPLKEFAFASDEFYVRAGRAIPGYEAYGDFPQLDDGVGTARLLTQDFFALENRLPSVVTPAKKYVAVTGKLGAMVLSPIVQRLNEIQGLYVDLVAVENRFWGEAVTVSGLITAQDIVATLAGQDLSGYTGILIPDTMLKAGEPIFLDGMTTLELSETLKCPVVVVENPSHAESLMQVLFHNWLSQTDPLSRQRVKTRS